MASIVKQIDVNADAGRAWARIADAGSVDQLVSMITACRLEGDTRYCTMADGSELVEQVVTVDDDNMRLAYRISGGAIPFEFHAGSMQVHANGMGSRLVWTFDFKPDALSAAIAPMLDAAAESIKSALA